MVTQDFPPERGGIPTYCWELARRLATRTEELLVVAPASAGSDEVDREAPYEVQRVRARSDLLGVTAAPALSAILWRRRFDLAFHAQWMTSAASLLARRMGWLRRVVIAAHGRELLLRPWAANTTAQRGYDAARQRALGAADLLLPVSRYTASLLTDLGAAPDRIEAVPNGVDPHRFDQAHAAAPRASEGIGDRPVLLTVARLVARKGIDTMIEALPRVRERFGEVVYVIIGDGPDRGRLEQRASAIGGDIRLLGSVDERTLGDWYAACDLFVMPASSEPPDVEGFGLVFLEAGSASKAVIGSTEGGIPDAVEDGVTGQLVPPRAPAALADAVIDLLSDPERRSQMGAAGRARALANDWDAVANRIAAHFDKLLNSHADPGDSAG